MTGRPDCRVAVAPRNDISSVVMPVQTGIFQPDKQDSRLRGNDRKSAGMTGRGNAGMTQKQYMS
ncbi:MAG: hypothetical protein EA357_02410 [Micavibrio sp.]|nr:MAG: hypothetical protein EA357_02410 [Micavibrio sp.]